MTPRNRTRVPSDTASLPSASLPPGSTAALVSDIPIINISPAAQGGQALTAVAKAIDDACRSAGFLIVTGHDVDTGVITEAWDAAREFFDLPLAEKTRVPPPSHDHAYGYSPLAGEALARTLDEETLPDLKESLSMGPLELPPSIPAGAEGVLTETDWPDNLPGLRPAWEAYFQAMSDLATRLLRLMAVALGLDADYFEPFLPYHTSAMRAINYPHIDSPLPSGQLRAGAHTDYGTLSILTYNAAPGGLEVKTEAGWKPIPPVPGGFAVNLGDLMARWTNDRWVSTLHRGGVPPAGTGNNRRQSIAFFHNAAWDAEIRCIPTCLVEGDSPKYEPVLAGPHLLSKFSSALGEY